jgi:medium-chain acyl-[acyl-carrier-protein] hydrolase
MVFMSHNADSLDQWFENLLPLSDVNCLMFPYSGSGVAQFAPWKKGMRNCAGLYAVRMPARESKLALPPSKDLVALSLELAESIAQSDLASRKLALVGCSMGGVLAFEVACALQREGVAIQLLVVAACHAPNGSHPRLKVQHLSDDDFIRELNSWYDAIPSAIANNHEARSLMLPAIRGDMAMLENYQYTPEPPLECEILSLCGTDDRAVTSRHMRPWRQLAKSHRHREISGGHFFMKSQYEEVGQLICRRLEQI